ncbi:MAG: transcriptional regulator [Desulfobacteraceae bacterium]|nr:MAG: transcriptional regulator [Desulfobacteraceae bacterium]
METVAVLKKYSNRRLYDTEKSLYVTLAEVAEMIRGGRQVKVVDAQTKEDVTAFILTQVILEEAKSRKTLLPVPLLHLIIRFGDNLLVDFFENYLQQTIQAYVAQKTLFEEQFKQWIRSGVDLSEATRQSMGNLAGIQKLFDLNPFLKFGASDKQEEGGEESSK